jgi:hypothetical protein
VIPRLGWGKELHLELQGRIDSSGSGDLVNCAELISLDQIDTYAPDNRACVTMIPHWCSDPEIDVRISIGRDNRTSFEHPLVTPVMLQDRLDDAEVANVRIEVDYDSTLMRIENGGDVASLTAGTLLAGWRIIGVDSLSGNYSIQLASPDDSSWIRGTGLLLNPRFRMHLGTVTGSELPLHIAFPGNNCAVTTTGDGHAEIDSVCGLAFRLIQVGPGQFILRQNDPNPFNPSTTIDFSLGLDGPTRLDVLDAAGHLVETLIDRSMDPGNYRVDWDASRQPSGLYYCRIRSGAWSRTIRMLLVK